MLVLLLIREQLPDPRLDPTLRSQTTSGNREYAPMRRRTEGKGRTPTWKTAPPETPKGEEPSMPDQPTVPPKDDQAE